MRDNYIQIAAKLGGEKEPAILEFYPDGKSEYVKRTKTKPPTIMERLKTAATSYDAFCSRVRINQITTNDNHKTTTP